MRNDIINAAIYQGFIDEELTADSKTQWMVPPADQIEYAGGDTVKIADITTSGMGNYDEEATGGNAYPLGKVTQKWTDYTFELDRAVDFLLSRTAPSDSGFISTVENVIKTFTQKELVKEVDTYRLNRIYNSLVASTKYSATHKFEVATITESNILEYFKKCVNIAKEDSENTTEIVAYMPLTYIDMFRSISKSTNHTVEFGKAVSINGIKYTNVTIVDGVAILDVPASRLQTKIVLNDGRTDGQKNGGITSATESKQIHMLVVGIEAPIAVTKINSLKQFLSDENQLADGTAIKFHQKSGTWVKKNQIVTISAVVVPTTTTPS